MSCGGMMRKAHHHLSDAPHESLLNILGVADYLDVLEAGKQLPPQTPQLHFGQPIAHTPVHTESERDVIARIGTIDNEIIRILENAFVAVTRGIPHQDRKSTRLNSSH